MHQDTTIYWVGKFKDKNESIYVFDPTIQGGDQKSVYLFNIVTQNMQKLNRDYARNKITKITDRGTFNYAILVYKNWKKNVGDNINLEEYCNLSQIKPDFRATHCWKCGIQIDSGFNKVCPKCKWLICKECGACRCQLTISNP